MENQNNEENKEGKENPAPASGEQNKEEAKGEETKEKGIDNQAELERTQKELKELKEKSEKQLGQAGHTIQKLKEKMKEEGVELEEEGKITEDAVRNIVSEETGKIKDIVEKQVSEVIRSMRSKESKGTGGSEGGQKKPQEEKAPELSSEDQKIIERYNLKYDAKQNGYVDANGRVHKF